MSTDNAKSPSFLRMIGSASMVACCILLVPVLLLSLAYLEHVFIGTHRLKEALHIDQLIHYLDAASPRR
jgi:hypothetical protein